MKQLIKYLLLLLALLLPATAFGYDYEEYAYDFEVNGIYYKFISNNNVGVSPQYFFYGCYPNNEDDEYYEGYYSNYTGDVIIPPTVTYSGETYSVTTIASSAFSGSNRLTSVSIPYSITNIGSSVFSGCSHLTSIVVASGNPTYDSRNNCNAIIETASNTLIAGCKSSVIPNSVTSIGYSAFFGCSDLTSVTIPNSVTSIGGGAFQGCSGLTSVDIPNSVTSIGYSAFQGCSGLTSVTIPNSVTSIGGRAFQDCSCLTSVIIPNSVISIAYEAFSGCSGLTNVTIPNSVTTIGYSAFQDCCSLTSVIIPNSVTSIAYEAFSGCSGLTNVTIPNSVTTIGGGAFSGCSSLTTVTIGNSVTTIYDNAFYGCPYIAKVTLFNPAPPSCGNLSTFNNNVYNHANLYVPKESVASYKASENWGQFIHIIGVKTSNDIFAESIKLNHRVVNLGVGSTNQLFATVLPDSTTNKSVTWISDNEDVAMVDTAGVVTAIAVGTATITATTTDGTDLSASCVIQVYEDLSQFDNYLTFADTTVMHGETVVIPVAMVNDASIVSFQTDIFLPEGLEIVQEEGEYVIDPSPRMTRTHSIMSSDAVNGSVRVLCYSSNYKPFTGNSGDVLFYITVKAADDIDGDYPIALKNTLFTTADFEELTIPDMAANVNVLAYLLGDANNSGTVTVTDVVVTAQYVLDKDPHPFVFDAADVNVDGFITVTDVTRIAWMVLNENAVQAPMLRAPALNSASDRLSAEGVTMSPGETRKVSIALDNELDYSAFQLDLRLPEGITASNFTLTDRASSHALDVNTLNNGATRVLCYSPSVATINGHDGALLTFDVTASSPIAGDITVDGIELVTTACQTVLMDAFTIGVNTVTAVNEVSSDKAVARVDYYNVAGQRLSQPTSGVNLVVTTYTDGTRATTKIIK